MLLSHHHAGDYRGPDGIWTEAVAQGKVVGEPDAAGETPWDEAFYRLLPAARPTFTHLAITALMQPSAGRAHPLVRHVITQNEDALHRRAGVAAEQLSELHGNAFVELCGKHVEGDSDPDMDSSDEDEASLPRAVLEQKARQRAARLEEIELARRLRPAGCGASVVRGFVTYHGETYRKDNPGGRHVTGRACPHCRGATASPAVAEGAAEGTAEAAEAAEAGQQAGAAGPREGPGWLLDSTVDFGEMPGGFPWGHNAVHNVAAAKRHMQLADLVVVWGSSLSVLANYFDPWHPDSRWAKPPPAGLRLAPPPARKVSAKAPAAKASRRAFVVRKPRPCILAVVSKGDVLDQELAAVKIDGDVDEVARELLRLLGVAEPPAYEPSRDPFAAQAVPPFAGEPAAPWTINAALGLLPAAPGGGGE